VEEPARYFENAFLIDCQNLILSIKYPNSQKINQVTLYTINQETDEKTKSEIPSTIRKNNESVTVTWTMTNNIKGQTYRIEW